jgi:hypothetical protein
VPIHRQAALRNCLTSLTEAAAAVSEVGTVSNDDRIEGLCFALLAIVLSFVANNRDTQVSMRRRLGSPATKGGTTTQVLSAFVTLACIPPETD